MNLPLHFSKTLKKLGVSRKAKLLIGVSGGLDSMVLLHLAKTTGYDLVVAHVNYKLRGDDSEADEILVKNTCEAFEVLFISKHATFKSTLKTGLQNWARNIRYAFFKEIQLSEKCDFILTGHHAEDRLETFFINLIRGSGIRGLKSIPERNGSIIRPLLHVRKTHLSKYALEHNVVWREDASNSRDIYLRNRIRHLLLPQIDTIHSNALTNANHSMDILAEAHRYFVEEARRILEEFETSSDLRIVPIDKWIRLFATKPLDTYVFQELGFNTNQLTSLQQLSHSAAGKVVIGKYHNAYKDRNRIVLEPINTQVQESVLLHTMEGSLDQPLKLMWHPFLEGITEIDTHTHSAYLNADKLHFPLTLRRWQAGDTFQPFGMTNFKKVSDYLIDKKVSIPEKNRTFVLLSQNEICWLIGFRIDNRYKISANCSVLKFTTSARL